VTAQVIVAPGAIGRKFGHTNLFGQRPTSSLLAQVTGGLLLFA